MGFGSGMFGNKDKAKNFSPPQLPPTQGTGGNGAGNGQNGGNGGTPPPPVVTTPPGGAAKPKLNVGFATGGTAVSDIVEEIAEIQAQGGTKEAASEGAFMDDQAAEMIAAMKSLWNSAGALAIPVQTSEDESVGKTEPVGLDFNANAGGGGPLDMPKSGPGGPGGGGIAGINAGSAKDQVQQQLQQEEQMQAAAISYYSQFQIDYGQIFPDPVCLAAQAPSEWTGKDRIYRFNPRLFVGNFDTPEGGAEIIKHAITALNSNSDDPIRDMLGKYWTLHAPNPDADDAQFSTLVPNQITFAQNPFGKLGNAVTTFNKNEIFTYYFPQDQVQAQLHPAHGSQVVEFLPQLNNSDAAEKFSLTDVSGIPINRETIVIWTDKNATVSNLTSGEPPGINAWNNFRFKKIYEKIQADLNPAISLLAGRKEDHVFISSTPYELGEPETPELVQNGNFLYVSQDANYNFYSREYENTLNNSPGLQESLLPSLLIAGANEAMPSFQEVLNGVTEDFSFHLADQLDDHLTLGGEIAMDSESIPIDPPRTGDPVATYSLHKQKGNYFRKWSRAYNSAFSDLGDEKTNVRRFFEHLTDKHSTQLVIPGSTYHPADYAPRKKQFPMDITLSFGTPQKGYSYQFLQTVKGCSDRNILDMISEFTLLDLIDYYDLRVPFFKTLADKTAKKVVWPAGFPIWEGSDNVATSKALWDEYNYSTKERIIGDTLGWAEPPNDASRINASSRQTLNFYRGDMQVTLAALPGNPTAELKRSWLSFFKMAGSAMFSGDEGLIGSIVDSDIVLGDKIASKEFLETDAAPIRNARCENLKEALNRLVKTKTRTFKQILEGKVACSETLGFRVEKIAIGEDDQETIVQNFLLPYPRAKELDFVDTQIKYGKKYKYKIYAFKAVFGTEYEYQFPQSYIKTPGDATGQNLLGAKLLNHEVIKNPVQLTMDDTGAKKYAMFIDVISRPSIKIIEVPYHELSPIRVLDRPPMAPNVEIFPYRGKNNNYLINLESATGREVTLPIGIRDEDAQIFFNQYEAQYPNMQAFQGNGLAAAIFAATMAGLAGVEGPPGMFTPEQLRAMMKDLPLEYKADDPPLSYEVFRLETPPISYFDFENGASIEIPTEGVSSVSLRPHELGKTEPNKKYYYTFRTKDIHGNISNPTPIYEVINVDDGGATYLIVRAYELPKREKLTKRVMKKFLSIAPAIDQSAWTPPADDNGAVGSYIGFEPTFGSGLEDPLIDNGRQYKIRLTSKQTGKKIDLNIKFKSSKIETPEELEASWALTKSIWAATYVAPGVVDLVSSMAAAGMFGDLGGETE